jgi:hypothetical protein
MKLSFLFNWLSLSFLPEKIGKKLGIKPKAHYVRVAYGYPAYDLVWHTFEHDRVNHTWRCIRDDLFDEGRPHHFDIDMSIINFEKNITVEEKKFVLRFLKKHQEELLSY